MRFTPYGLAAACGLVAGMGLAGRLASAAKVDREAVWDTGLAAILSCFVASRLLLVLSDPRAFARYPLVVLSLPSLTIGGLALAALFMLVYLRLKRLSTLRMLDAFAPGAALLAAFLELGHALDGSEPGMPVTMSPGHLHPVAVYGVVASLCLALGLALWLQRTSTVGRTAALGLMLGGAIAFVLDLFTQPPFFFAEWPLEPGQIVALVIMLAGALLWTFSPTPVSTTLSDPIATRAEAP